MASVLRDGQPGAGGAFLQGLVTPSPLALLLALAVAASLLLSLTRLTAGHVAMVADWFGRTPNVQALDVYLVTGRALRLRASHPDRPGLVMLGGSTTRESFESGLADALLAQGPHPASVTDLTGSGQALLDSLTLADMLPQGFRGVVVLGVNPIRVGKPINRSTLTFPRYGVPSPTLREEGARLGLPLPRLTGAYALDERAFLIRMWGDMTSNVHALFRTHGAPRRHWYRNAKPFREAALQRHFALTRQALAGYDRSVAASIGMMGRLAARLRRQHVQLVVLEAPVNPRFVRESIGMPAYQHHVAEMRAFAAANRIPYLNFSRTVQVPDFYDWGHLRNPAATARQTRELVAAVRPYLDRSGVQR